MPICLYGDEKGDFTSMVNSLSEHDLPKTTRSTVPLLCYWKDYATRLPSFLGALGHAVHGDEVLSFEHQVESLNRKATPSHTDLMVLTRDCAIAIEGKWTEWLYPTIEKWHAAGKYPDSRERVVEHWLRLIQPFTETPLSFASAPRKTLVYQLLHRTASACASAGAERQAIVLYQVFNDGHHKHPDYVKMLRPLASWLGNTPRLRFAIVESHMKPTVAFRELQRRCDGMSEDAVASSIQKAIAEVRLFDFGNDAVLLL